MQGSQAEAKLAARQFGRFTLNSYTRDYVVPQPGMSLNELNLMCECGADDCDAWVALPIFLFDDLRLHEDFVLAQGHILQRTERARLWARRHREEASALRAEAQLQQQRARRDRDATPEPNS